MSKYEFLPSVCVRDMKVDQDLHIAGVNIAPNVDALSCFHKDGDRVKVSVPLEVGSLKAAPADFDLSLGFLSDSEKNDQVVTLAWIKQFMVSLGYFSGNTPGDGDAVAISADLLKYIDDKDDLRLLTSDALTMFADINDFLNFKSSTGRQLTNLNSLLNGQVEDIEHKFVIQDQYNSTLYNKQAVDGLLGAKASTTDLAASQTSVNNALAAKVDVSMFNGFQTQNINTLNMNIMSLTSMRT